MRRTFKWLYRRLLKQVQCLVAILEFHLNVCVKCNSRVSKNPFINFLHSKRKQKAWIHYNFATSPLIKQTDQFVHGQLNTTCVLASQICFIHRIKSQLYNLPARCLYLGISPVNYPRQISHTHQLVIQKDLHRILLAGLSISIKAQFVELKLSSFISSKVQLNFAIHHKTTWDNYK